MTIEEAAAALGVTRKSLAARLQRAAIAKGKALTAEYGGRGSSLTVIATRVELPGGIVGTRKLPRARWDVTLPF
jgi:hypothetical protein